MEIIIVILGAIIFFLLYLKCCLVMTKYGYNRLWIGVRKRPNMVPIHPQTGRMLRAGDKVKIVESEAMFIYRDSLNDKKCICRNEMTNEIIEATLDDMYFQKRTVPSSVPEEQKKDLHVCIYYPEDFSFFNRVTHHRIGGGSNRVKNDMYFLLSKYAPMYHIHIGKTQSSLENYYFYNELFRSLRSGDDIQNVEMDEYDSDLSYGTNADGTSNRADLLIVVGDNATAQDYILTAKRYDIETHVIR